RGGSTRPLRVSVRRSVLRGRRGASMGKHVERRRHGRTALHGAMVLAMASMLTAGCELAVNQQGGGSKTSCQRGGTLVAAAAQPPIPARVLAQGAANFFWVRAVFEPLLTVDGNDVTKLKPLLASSYKIAPDDRSVTLQLRDNVTFHSGRPF